PTRRSSDLLSTRSDDELRRGFLHSFGVWTVPLLMIRGELAWVGRIFVPQTSHEGGTVKRRPSSFRHAVPLLNRCIRGSSPSVDCGFDARRTSHSVAVHKFGRASCRAGEL